MTNKNCKIWLSLVDLPMSFGIATPLSLILLGLPCLFLAKTLLDHFLLSTKSWCSTGLAA